MTQLDLKKFFALIRASLYDNKLPASAVTALEAIIDKCREEKVHDLRHVAYIMATAYHEVGSALVPKWENLNYSAQGLADTWPHRYAVDPAKKVKVPNALAKKLAHKPEAIANNCYANRMGNGDEKSGDGWKFRGGGWPQVTGRDNFRRCGLHAKVDLERSPERINEIPISACNLVVGMRDGWFTGKRLSHYIGKTCDFTGARWIINRQDKASLIAGYAEKFLTALNASAHEKAPARVL